MLIRIHVTYAHKILILIIHQDYANHALKKRIIVKKQISV